MTNTKILTIAAIAIFSAGLTANHVLAEGPEMEVAVEAGTATDAKAIPDWVDQSFRWYGEGKIPQSDLLNSMKFLLDKNIMHISDQAAKEVHELREENKKLREYSVQYRESDLDFTSRLGEDSKMSGMAHHGISAAAVPVLAEDGTISDVMVVGADKDINALVQSVLRESYGENNKDLQFYADKVKFHNDMKEAIRDHANDMRNKRQMAATAFENAAKSDTLNPDVLNPDILNPDVLNPEVLNPDILNPDILNAASKDIKDVIERGETDANYWEDRFFDVTVSKYSGVSSTVDDLQGVVVLCNVAMDKELGIADAELKMIQEATKDLTTETDSDYTRSDPTGTATLSASSADTNEDKKFWLEKLRHSQEKLESIQTGLRVCEEKMADLDEELQTMGDDAQLANLDLQNMLQKQQQTMQMMSNISKMLHDTAMSVIRNMGG